MPESVVESVSTGRPRRGSLGLLRRSKSHESTTRRSPSDGKNKLVRKNKNYGSMSNKEGRELSSQGSQREAPRLPTYQQLPRMATPFETGENNNPAALSPPRQSNTTTSLYSGPHSSVSLASRSRSGSNPNASYYYSNMDRSSAEPPVPPVPDSARANFTPELPSRTESMTHRGRYSYASPPFGGNTNSPRRIRRRKDPTPFNVLVVGTQGSGKTAFIEFLRNALYRPVRTRPGTPSSSQQQASSPNDGSSSLFTPQYVETEYDSERIGLTVYDSKGLDAKIIDLQLREISRFVESKFQETFAEERKVLRAPGAKDTHIHCVFMMLDPARLDFNVAATGPQAHENHFHKLKVVGALDERVDVELLRVLEGKTTVIPVISKADTVTTAHMSFLKRTVCDSLKKLKIDPLEALNLDSDDEEDTDYDTASSAQHSGDEDADEKTVANAKDDEINDKDVINNLADPRESKTEPSDRAKTSQGQESKSSKVPTELDSPHLPLSIISPDMYDPGTVGRRFPWGFADPYNADHCDFVRLKDNVFGEWRTDLQESARDRWYEGWRTSRLDRAKKSLSPRSSQQRAVSNAAAYGGKGLESTLSQQPTNGSSGSRTVSASNIGVAISNPSGGPPLPKTNYRGVGTY